MEKIQGVPLREKWKRLAPADKLKVFVQVHKFQEKWSATKFPKIGSLYYRSDLLAPPDDDYLFRDEEGTEISMPEFAVGPATGREWIDHGRQHLDCGRGPCKSFRYKYNR